MIGMRTLISNLSMMGKVTKGRQPGRPCSDAFFPNRRRVPTVFRGARCIIDAFASGQPGNLSGGRLITNGLLASPLLGLRTQREMRCENRLRPVVLFRLTALFVSSKLGPVRGTVLFSRVTLF